jgi:hypothetical protein
VLLLGRMAHAWLARLADGIDQLLCSFTSTIDDFGKYLFREAQMQGLNGGGLRLGRSMVGEDGSHELKPVRGYCYNSHDEG